MEDVLKAAVTEAMRTMTAQEVSTIVRKTVNGIAARRLFTRLSQHQGDFEAPLPPPSKVVIRGRAKWMNWLPDDNPHKQAYLPPESLPESVRVKRAPVARPSVKRSYEPTEHDLMVVRALGVKPPKRNRVPLSMRG